MSISCRIVRLRVLSLRLLSIGSVPGAKLGADMDLRLVRRMEREESLLSIWERAVR